MGLADRFRQLADHFDQVASNPPDARGARKIALECLQARGTLLVEKWCDATPVDLGEGFRELLAEYTKPRAVGSDPALRTFSLASFWSFWLHTAQGLGAPVDNPLAIRYQPQTAEQEREGLRLGESSGDDWQTRCRESAAVCQWLADEIDKAGVTIEPDGAGDADLGPLEKALALLVIHPDWTHQQIADAVGVTRTTLYKPAWSMYRDARKALRGAAQGNIPRGSKNGDTGKMEAWDGDTGDTFGDT